MAASVLDIASAASELGVSAARVRALAASGQIEAEKIGGRWLISRAEIASRAQRKPAPGRPMSARNAWGVLAIASGEDEHAAHLDSVAQWRIRQALAQQGIAGLAGKLANRAAVHRYWALPEELRALHDHGRICLSGSSAAGAYGLDLVAPDAVDGYVRAAELDHLVKEHALAASDLPRANLILRAVPGEAWALENRSVAPFAAVALDLADYPDARSARVGNEALRRIDMERARR